MMWISVSWGQPIKTLLNEYDAAKDHPMASLWVATDICGQTITTNMLLMLESMDMLT